MVSYRETERILRIYWYHDIPKDVICKCKVIFDNVLSKIAESIVKEHVNYNELRKKYKLLPKQRLSIDAIFSHGDGFINHEIGSLLGESGQHNRDTDSLQDAMEIV